MIAATQTTSCFITQLSRLLLSLNICTVNAEAGISLTQPGRDRGGWSLLWARLLRILLVSCAIFFFFISDTLLASQLLRGNEGAYPFISYTFSLMTVFALWFVSRDVYTMAYAAVPQQGLSTSTPPTLSLWAHLSRIGHFIFVMAAMCLCQLTSIFMALVVFLYVDDQYAVLYTTVVIQIAVLVFLILGGKQALVFFVGEQYVSPLQAASALSIEGGGGSSDRNGDVSVASLSTTTTTSAVTAPVNMLSSMRSALSGIAASLSTPSASVADGAYSALSAEDSVHGLHSSMVVVTGVPVHAPVAGQREGSTNII